MNNLNGPDSIKKGDYGYSSESLSKSSKRARQSSAKAPANSRRAARAMEEDKKKLRNSTILGMLLVIIQLALSGYFVYLLMTKNLAFITDVIFIGICAGLVLLLIIVFAMQTAKKRKTKRAGKVISIIVCIALGICIYLLNPWSAMSGAKVDENPFVVFVSATDTFGDLNKEGNER